MKYEVRHLEGHREYLEGVRLQRETWGHDFRDCVPPSLMILAQHLGGLAAGAFDADHRMVGFLYGLTGIEEGCAVHWSHMTAVSRSLRDQGIGRLLKLFQRKEMLRAGIDKIYWTFDPLVARNAHLNLNRLGARIQDYFPDFYADMGSDLHRGLGTDRFRAVWHIGEERVEQVLAGRYPSPSDADLRAPIVNTRLDASGQPQPIVEDLSLLPAVRIEIPADIHAVDNASEGAGQRWRSCTRRAFQGYLDRGYDVCGFHRSEDGRCFYVARKEQ